MGGRGIVPLHLNVLVVEDDAVNMKMICHMLRRFGCQTTAAHHGGEALAVLATHGAFDVILMDCRMPVMDGYTATEHIRRLPGQAARTPIIAVTANTAPEDRARCAQVGMTDFLAKPINMMGLHGALERTIMPAPCLAATG